MRRRLPRRPVRPTFTRSTFDGTHSLPTFVYYALDYYVSKGLGSTGVMSFDGHLITESLAFCSGVFWFLSFAQFIFFLSLFLSFLTDQEKMVG